jgi:hypothetical protein
MSCAGKGYGTNPSSDDYLYSQFSSYIATNSVRPKTTRNCRKSKSSYPSFTPILSSLSTTSSPLGGYSLVYVLNLGIMDTYLLYITVLVIYHLLFLQMLQ